MEPFDYDRGEIHLRYDGARSFSPAALELWMGRLAAHVPREGVETIVDVGCGTGRFTAALAEVFAATVYGVEPSAKMLEVARENVARSHARARIKLLEGAAEAVPVDEGAADLVFLSMVYHHIRDKRRACAEFRRVLRPSGRLVIRTATREGAGSYLWLSFFPEAAEIESGRTPSREELTNTLGGQGFRLAAHEIVRQPFAEDFREYEEKISLRGLSSLQAIPDEAFASGLARLREFCDAQPPARPVYEEVDLFVFAVADRAVRSSR